MPTAGRPAVHLPTPSPTGPFSPPQQRPSSFEASTNLADDGAANFHHDSLDSSIPSHQTMWSMPPDMDPFAAWTPQDFYSHQPDMNTTTWSNAASWLPTDSSTLLYRKFDASTLDPQLMHIGRNQHSDPSDMNESTPDAGPTRSKPTAGAAPFRSKQPTQNDTLKSQGGTARARSSTNATTVTPATLRTTETAAMEGSSQNQAQPAVPSPHQPTVAQRPHRAVERRYLSTLNDKYALLAKSLGQQKTQRICKLHARHWDIGTLGQQQQRSGGPAAHGKPKPNNGQRQGKTVTLTTASETIRLMESCCRARAADVHGLRQGLRELHARAQQLLAMSAQLKLVQ